MANYDFSTINDKEFEDLVNDVVEKRDGQTVESYKQGPDQGIDGRSIDTDGNVTIIQSKHWIKSGVASLIRALKKTEVDKVRKLNPSRYILATSLELSEKNKVEIKLAFAPYIKDIKDILGNEDINHLISDNENIELKYYNLWINSTTVIRRMLNNATHIRSKSTLENIISNSKLYVKTSVHSSAEDTLEANNIILITGNAGIGKTTLAEQMCKIYTAKGYAFFHIVNSIDEIDQMYNELENQVYFYDDFLGSNYLEQIRNREDVILTHLILRIRKDPTKKLILTTRTNIYEQSKLLTELFERVKISTHEIQIKAEKITRFEKAKILYNHIWFSDLSHEYRDELVKDLRYFQVIDHQNFNPRLIEFITDSCHLNDIDPVNYWDYVLETLRNPKNVWRHVLSNQTNRLCNHLVVGIVLNGGVMSSDELSSYFYRLVGSDIHPKVDENHDTTIKLLVGSLINRNIGYDNKVNYSLFNPSIADYILGEHSSNSEYLSKVFSKLKTNKSLNSLTDYFLQKIINKDTYIKCLVLLSKDRDEFSIYNRTLSYKIIRIPKFERIPSFKEYLSSLSESILDISLVNNEQLSVIIKMLDNNILDVKDEKLIAFVTNILNSSYDDTYFVELSKILFRLGLLTDDNFDILCKNIHEYYESNLTDIVIDSDCCSSYYSESDISIYGEDKVRELIEDDLSELVCPPWTEVYELALEIAPVCNYESIIEYNIERSDYSPSYLGKGDRYYSGSDFSEEITSYFRQKD